MSTAALGRSVTTRFVHMHLDAATDPMAAKEPKAVIAFFVLRALTAQKSLQVHSFGRCTAAGKPAMRVLLSEAQLSNSQIWDLAAIWFDDRAAHRRAEVRRSMRGFARFIVIICLCDLSRVQT